MKLVAWIGEDECHKAIACKLHVNKGLAGLVIKRTPSFFKNLSAGVLFEKAIENFAVRHINTSWKGMQQYYRSNFPAYPEVETLYCESIDDPDVISFTNKFAPDLVVLSGVEVYQTKTIETNLKIGYLQIGQFFEILRPRIMHHKSLNKKLLNRLKNCFISITHNY